MNSEEWIFGPVETHHHTEDDLRRMRDAMPDRIDKSVVHLASPRDDAQMLSPDRIAAIADEVARLTIERVEMEYGRDYPEWGIQGRTPWERALAHLAPLIAQALAGMPEPPEDPDE